MGRGDGGKVSGQDTPRAGGQGAALNCPSCQQIWVWAWVRSCLKSMPHPLTGGPAPPTPLDTVGLVDQRLGDAGTRDPGAQPPPASLPTHLAPDSSRWGSWVRGTSRSPGEPTSQTPPSRSCPSPQAPVLWAAPEGIQETARSLALADPNPCRDLWFCLHPGRQRHGPLGPPSAEGHRTGLER